MVKTISWSVKLRTKTGIETKTYRDLKSLSEDLRIHRSIVYRIYNGQTTSGRHKNILRIDKMGLNYL